MKKTIAIVFSSMFVFLLTGCKGNVIAPEPVEDAKPVTLNVTTTWAGTDGNSKTYQKWAQNYMDETGNIINDFSGGADENFKKRVLLDFQVGGEPDVLFYFNGSDANPFIEADKVVPLSTIQEEYPEYASNLEESVFVPSEVDGQVYAVPIYGYWEALFVNKKVCEAADVEIPGPDTDWNEFLAICEQIKNAGFTPIAASLAKEPHYWFEFVIYNQIAPADHGQIPTSLEEECGVAWAKGLTDVKDLYQRGYFAQNTLYCSADESFQSFLDGKAAFLVDGSWKIGTIVQKANNLGDFGVTYVPGKGERKATDIIGGFSSGWYITRKAWEDPDKRQAAVEFITYMTQDQAVSDFATTALSATTLKNKTTYDDTNFCQMQKEAVAMLDNSTSIVTAVQDKLSVQSRAPLFEGMSDIVTEKMTVVEAMERFFKLREAEEAKE